MTASSPLQRDIDTAKLQSLLSAAKNDKQLFDVIVNAPFKDKLQMTVMGLGIIVLLLVNKKTGTIDRLALSKNEQAEGTLNMSTKKFEEIKIPVGYTKNIIAKAIQTGHQQSTTNWEYLFTPELTAEEARLNQAGGAIAYSVVQPLLGTRDGGALIFSFHQYPSEIGAQHHAFMKTYSNLVAESLRQA
jgi:hypothetical protein